MIRERLFNVLVEPHFTEKATRVGDAHQQYVFKVLPDATKTEVRQAVESIFKVEVRGVTTLNVKGKVKRTVRGLSSKKSWKKAYVRLAPGQEIDFTSID